jgi:hypothetical protein
VRLGTGAAVWKGQIGGYGSPEGAGLWRLLLLTGLGTLYIEPRSPWENGYLESFNGKLRNEPPVWEVFGALLEEKVLVARWRTL